MSDGKTEQILKGRKGILGAIVGIISEFWWEDDARSWQGGKNQSLANLRLSSATVVERPLWDHAYSHQMANTKIYILEITPDWN